MEICCYMKKWFTNWFNACHSGMFIQVWIDTLYLHPVWLSVSTLFLSSFCIKQPLAKVVFNSVQVVLKQYYRWSNTSTNTDFTVYLLWLSSAYFLCQNTQVMLLSLSYYVLRRDFKKWMKIAPPEEMLMLISQLQDMGLNSVSKSHYLFFFVSVATFNIKGDARMTHTRSSWEVFLCG